MIEMGVTDVVKGMIGLEVHVYLLTREKLFCPCIASREKGVQPNVYVCPICTGMPGAKPMLPNKNAVQGAVLIGLMLGCRIHERLGWMRKHYSWADLPKGYQNTLSGTRAFPLGVGGTFHGIRIRSVHLEEDPASWEPLTGRIDYNRSGLPLVEIITEPDFTSAEEVGMWLERLLHNLAYLKIVASDAGIKVDVNVSIPKKTERVEVKNVNSVESIVLAIAYELERQLREGSVRETRRFDAVRGVTMVMREKEGAEDYRFIRDPDLLDLVIESAFVENLKRVLPDPPEKKLTMLRKKYKIDEKNASVLAKHLEIVEFFEQVAVRIDPKFALPWVTIELLRHLNYHKTRLDKVDINVDHFVALLELVKNGTISELQGKQLLNTFYPSSYMPAGVEKKIDDHAILEGVCMGIISEEREGVARYKAGDVNVLNFLIGRVMEKTNRRADFRIVRSIIEQLLH